MISLTPRQRECLDFIEDYMLSSRGIAPSIDEISVALGRANKSTVHRLLHSLQERGHIRRTPNRARAMEIVRSTRQPMLNGEPLMFIPVHALGVVHA